MDSQEEIHSAILAILRVHTQMRADYHELLRRLHAIRHSEPLGLALLRNTQDEWKPSSTEEAALVNQIEVALKGSQPFAALLQEYASLLEVPLNEHIQNLTQAGFQTTVR
jgi:hypothetical protein